MNVHEAKTHVSRLLDRLAITDQHALAAGSLAGEHRDPFDRTIAAQAITEDLDVVTSDQLLAGLPEVRARC